MSLEMPDMCVVKEYLEGVGIYDESMGKNDMIRYYNFIKPSEPATSTATEQKKSNEEDLDKIEVIESPPSTPKNRKFKPNIWSSAKKPLDSPVSSNNNNSEAARKELPVKEELNSSQEDKSDSDEVGVKELLQRENLRRSEVYKKLNSIDVYSCQKKNYMKFSKPVVEPKFASPIYCQESFKNLSVHEKVRLITEYHDMLAQAQYKQQRKSLKLAALPASIQPSLKYTKDAELKKSIDSDNLNPEQTYTSRSGRTVKRKVYAEGLFSEDEDSPVGNSKDDIVKSAKKAKSSDDDFDSGKLKDDPKKSSKKNKGNFKKITNQEIMSRSALFADSPSTTKTRSERLFDKTKEEQVRMKKAEDEKEKFEASLERIDVDDEDFDLKITSSQQFISTPQMGGVDAGSEETVTKLRVLPPITGRKGYKRSQTLVPVQEVVKKPETVTSSPDKTITLSDDSESGKKNTPHKKEIKRKLQLCPICNQGFPRKDIEDHASTCGLTSELEIENDLPTTSTVQSADTLRCEICEKTFLLNTLYEVHVRECIDKHSN